MYEKVEQLQDIIQDIIKENKELKEQNKILQEENTELLIYKERATRHNSHPSKKAYYEKHKEELKQKITENMKKRREENPEEFRKKQNENAKKYYQKKKEKQLENKEIEKK